MWNQDNYNKIIDFVGRAHNGQMNYAKDMPYVVHLAKVADEAIKLVVSGNYVGNPDLLIAVALLHDILEDTNTTYEQLEYMFGETVAKCVLSLTRNTQLDEDGSIVREASLLDSIQRIKKQPIEAAIVKLCDRITNLQDVPVIWTRDKVEQYKKESQILLNELGYANEYLKERLRQKIENYNNYIND